MAFAIFIVCLIALRFGELFLSGQNEQWLLRNGAVEFGRSHYPVIVALHTGFIVSLLLEFLTVRPQGFVPGLLGFYVFLLACKAWVIFTLGRYWTTRIYRIPGAPVITTGPYKFIKHPNYLIVVGEIAVIPLAFHLYYTAVIFSVLNALMLRVRISEENRALQL